MPAKVVGAVSAMWECYMEVQVERVRADLQPEAQSVAAARRVLRDLLETVGAQEWVDAATLAASEVVTNAVVHTGASITVEAWAAPDGLRVEVGDASSHLPSPRHYAVTSGTGRGLHLVDSTVDRWGASPRPAGKVVWFELGRPLGVAAPETGHTDGRAAAAAPVAPVAPVAVTLRNVPLLMHWAWQEHAQALLREYLLYSLESDPAAMNRHAEAGDALRVLHEQLPVPELPDDPTELLADALEPGVSAVEVTLSVPRASIAHFATLDEMLERASAASSSGLFLGPPTQPEIAEMRDWICDEVARQTAHGDEPQPWTPRLDVRAPLVEESSLHDRYRVLSESDEAILATDEASIIVAVTPPVVRFLGYASESELLGRRVIVVVPQRFHQAHIAGTTLNATNGRDALLDVPITVPVVRADGSEAPVELVVNPRRIDDDLRVFVARFVLPE